MHRASYHLVRGKSGPWEQNCSVTEPPLWPALVCLVWQMLQNTTTSQVASGIILGYAQCRDTSSEGKKQPYCLEVLQHVSLKGVFARCVVCQSQIMANLFQVPLQRDFQLGSI